MSSPGSNDNGSQPQKIKTPARSPGSSFWPSKRARLEALAEKPAEADCKMATLKAEPYWKQTLKFRVTFVPRNQGGGNGYFRAADDTGERIFKAFAAEKELLSIIEFNKIYTLTGFKVQMGYFGKDDEIVFVRTSKLAKVDGCTDFPIPFIKKTLEEITHVAFGDTFDTIGIVVGIDSIPIELRLTITDETKEEAVVRFYQEDKELTFEVGDVLMLRHAKKGHDFDQVMSISVHFLTHVWRNPPRGEATNLKTWFTEEVQKEAEEFPGSE